MTDLRADLEALADEFEADFDAYRNDYPASYLRLREVLATAALRAAPVTTDRAAEGVATSLFEMLDLFSVAIGESGRTQRLLARDAGLSEKHVSQMMTGRVDGSLQAWQALLVAAGLTVRVELRAVLAAPVGRDATDEHVPECACPPPYADCPHPPCDCLTCRDATDEGSAT